MLRVAGKKLSSLPSVSLRASPAFIAQGGFPGTASRFDGSSKSISPTTNPLCFSSRFQDLIRGYSSGEVTKLSHGGVVSHLGNITLPKGLAPYQHTPLRHYASPASEQNNTPQSFRPLSPHLPVYQPQLNSTLSILNRISGVYLAGVALAFYLLTMNMGSICLTYESFYKTLFYSSKLIPVTLEISALALTYHLYASIRHMKKL